MLINKRPDGCPAQVPSFTKLMPILMQTRTESTIYMEQTIELDKTLVFIEKWNQNLPEDCRPLTVMQILLAAMARAVAMRPRLNRFISNYRHYQRNNISFSFVTKKTLSDDGKEVNVTMPFKPEDTLEDVCRRFTAYVGTAKSDDGNKSDQDVDLFTKLPVWVLRAILGVLKFLDRRNWVNAEMLRLFPFYASAFVTNVGSLKLDAPFHHNYELGNTGLFIALGRFRKEKYIADDNSIQERTAVKVNYTFDDRIVDGIYSGRAIKIIKDLVENPEKLVEPPMIDPKHIEELNLTEKGWKLWAI